MPLLPLSSTKKQINSQAKKQFGFLLAIIAVSVTAVIILFAYSLYFLTPSFTALITENTEHQAIQIATNITHTLFTDNKPFHKQTLTADFPKKLALIIEDFGLMKVKIFSPSGEIIFSTAPEDIGLINDKDYFHTIIAKGIPFTKIVSKNDKSLEGQIVSRDVVETYVPLMTDANSFRGAFEIYFDITASKDKLSSLVSKSHQLLLLISGGLLLAILMIAFKAKRSILSRLQAEKKILAQSEALRAKNNELSILNEISAAISRSIDMDRLLPAILDTIASRFKDFSHVIRGGIFLSAGDKLHLTAHIGHDDAFLQAHHNMKKGECLCGQVAESGEIIFSTNSAADDRHTLCCDHYAPHGHVIIPLKAKNRVLGVLFLYTDADIEIIDKESLFISIGNQIGLAIDNANLYRETKKLSLQDPLTGLANRRYMDMTLEERVKQADLRRQPLSIAMADIDYFKRYNDTMGHDAGDRILVIVASMIKKEIHEADFAARYGGEEFLIILNETSGPEACLAAERIRKTIKNKAGVTTSIGIASHRQGDSVHDLVKRADNALYAAKDNGRNRVEFMQ